MKISKVVKSQRLTMYDRHRLYEHVREESGLKEVVKEKELALVQFLTDHILPYQIDLELIEIFEESPRLFRLQKSIAISLSELELLPKGCGEPYPNQYLGKEKLGTLDPKIQWKKINSSISIPLGVPFPKLTNERWDSDFLVTRKSVGDDPGMLLALQDLVMAVYDAKFEYENFKREDMNIDPGKACGWSSSQNFLRGKVTTLGQLLDYDEDLFVWYCTDRGLNLEEHEGQEPTKKQGTTIVEKSTLIRDLAKLKKTLEG